MGTNPGRVHVRIARRISPTNIFDLVIWRAVAEEFSMSIDVESNHRGRSFRRIFGRIEQFCRVETRSQKTAERSLGFTWLPASIIVGL